MQHPSEFAPGLVPDPSVLLDVRRGSEVSRLLDGLNGDRDGGRVRTFALGRVQEDGVIASPWQLSARSGNVVDRADAIQSLHDGETLLIKDVALVSDSIAAATRAMEARFGFPVMTHAFISPVGTTGVKPHRDEHPVVWVQIAGKKVLERWPAVTQSGEELNLKVVGAPTETLNLQPGDCVVTSPHTPHTASTPDASPTPSLHLVFQPIQLRLTDVLRVLPPSQAQLFNDGVPELLVGVPASVSGQREHKMVQLLATTAKRLSARGDTVRAEALFRASANDAVLLNLCDKAWKSRTMNPYERLERLFDGTVTEDFRLDAATEVGTTVAQRFATQVRELTCPQQALL